MQAATPFLERLDRAARELLLAVARPAAFPKGAVLVRHGEPARGAFVLREGAAEATVVMPGHERHVVARLAPGHMFGEAALIERATASATVTATARVEGWLLERDDFRAVVAQRQPAALALQHAVTLALVDKLRALNGQLLALAAGDDRPAPERAAGGVPGDPLAGVPRKEKTWFEHRRFLPLLPLFADFEPGDIEAAVAGVPLLEVARGQALFHAGQPSTACFLVVHGAVEVWARAGRHERRIAVVGPGNLVGYMSQLSGGVHGSSVYAREDTVLMEYGREAWEALYRGGTGAATRLHRAIHGALLAAMKRTNTQLTRLISAARLRGDAGEGDALQAAYSSQIVAAEPSREA